MGNPPAVRMHGKRIRVMIVDDSALVRQVAAMLLAREPNIEVLGTASDPLYALEKMRVAWPDVIILDIEMPRMDGLSFLRQLMVERPTPVVICSSLTESGSSTLMQALAAGAVSVITKPKAGVKNFLEQSAREMANAVRAAACANVHLLVHLRASTAAPAHCLPPDSTSFAAAPESLGFASDALHETTDKVIAIGTSTGGTHALEVVLTRLPVTTCGMVIVQHMPEKFTAMFAERLNALSRIEVREARNHDRVLPGRALIAPGGKHMRLQRNGAQYRVEVFDGPLVNRHKPSVDVLFRSVAKTAGRNALGVIMTGMGNDGARGLREMHDVGAATIAQDEASCVVFGMPREAIRLGGAARVLPLEQIPQALLEAGNP